MAGCSTHLWARFQKPKRTTSQHPDMTPWWRKWAVSCTSLVALPSTDTKVLWMDGQRGWKVQAALLCLAQTTCSSTARSMVVIRCWSWAACVGAPGSDLHGQHNIYLSGTGENSEKRAKKTTQSGFRSFPISHTCCCKATVANRRERYRQVPADVDSLCDDESGVHARRHYRHVVEVPDPKPAHDTLRGRGILYMQYILYVLHIHAPESRASVIGRGSYAHSKIIHQTTIVRGPGHVSKQHQQDHQQYN